MPRFLPDGHVFSQRIYLSLPKSFARVSIIQTQLGSTPHSLKDVDFQSLGDSTEGFSGSDISVLVKDVLMQPIRFLREATHFRQVYLLKDR